MITEYQIANFKAFGSPQTLPIRPITLIFGPNSSGKSSIFQSLLMLKQTMEESRGQETSLLFKGDLVDLGSYREFVHCHELHRAFSFKATMSMPKKIEEAFGDAIIKSERISDLGFLSDLEELIDFNRIGLGVSFLTKKSENRTFVSKISGFFGDDINPILIFEMDHLKNYKNYILKKINSKHYYWQTYWKKIKKENEKFARDFIRKKRYTLELNNFCPMKSMGTGINEKLNDWLEEFDLSLFLLAASHMFHRFLKEILYLGPLRENPERYFGFSGRRTRYVGKTGKFVPDLLISDKELKTRVNNWFKKLIGYEIKISSLTDPDTEVHELFAMRLRDKNGIHVALTDVGFGVSQVLPVIVQSVVSQGKTILIEQPEYHLHPRLQAELGDMFIESALGEQKNTFLIETHSEHLILRIMRRMRETFEGRLPEGMPPVKPEDVAVVYVEKDGDQSIIREMPLNDRGELVKAWPGGFFEEGFREVMA